MDKLSVSDAIGQIVGERGLDILKTPKILMSIIMDYVQGYEKEKRLLKIALQHNIFESAYEIHTENDDAQKEILQKKLESHLINDGFLSEENARIVMTTVLGGLGEKILLPDLQPIVTESPVEIQPTKEVEIKAIPVSDEAEKLYQKGRDYEFGRDVVRNASTAVNYYMEAAEKGHPAAQCKIGLCYKLGDVLAKNNVKAFSWFKKAAEQGNADAQNELAICYATGTGIAKDEKEAIVWYERSAAQGNALAQSNLAHRYKNGLGVQKDLQKAFELYKKAAEQGNMSAQRNLADMYEHGHGTSKSLPEAFRWYKEAAEQGDAEAQYRLYNCYHKGIGTTKNNSLAINWLAKASKQGHIDAQYESGMICYNHQQYDAAVKSLEKPAAQGYVEAQFRLGYCYNTGKGVQQNHQKAVELYRKAVAQGHAMAKNNLAYCYENGFGVPKDLNMAFKLYKEAAEQGEVLPQTACGVCYEKGIGTERNITEAIKWYQKAADQGNATAKEALARLENQPQELVSVNKNDAAVTNNSGNNAVSTKKPSKLSPYNAKDKFKLALICLFLGGLGIHNFMMGETKKGVVKIVASYFCGIGIILGILDFVKIIKGTYEVNTNAFL